MIRRSVIATLAVALGVPFGEIAYGAFVGLYGTGFDGSGSALGNFGDPDGNYALAGVPTGAGPFDGAQLTNPNPAWIQAAGFWIGPVNNGYPVVSGDSTGQSPPADQTFDSALVPATEEANGDDLGPYVYTTEFDLTGFNILSGSFALDIELRWASDNGGSVLLNGTLLQTVPSGTSPNRSFEMFTTLAINENSAGLQDGVNTLSFEIVNGFQPNNEGPSPQGLNVIVDSAQAVPAPTGLAGLASLAAMGISTALLRRARKSA